MRSGLAISFLIRKDIDICSIRILEMMFQKTWPSVKTNNAENGTEMASRNPGYKDKHL